MPGRSTGTRVAAPPQDEDKVQLEPFLGLRPGVYLGIAYGAIIIALIFFLLFFPGILRPGSVVSVKSEPWGAAVRLDDVYQGATPCEFFVPRGSHQIELVLPGFENRKISTKIPGRLAFSLFFPRRLGFEEQLSPRNSALEVAAAAAADYAAWTFVGEPTEAYQIPLSLSEGLYRAAPALAAEQENADEILKAAARFAVTKAALRDLLRAKAIADNGGLSPSPLSLLHSAEDILSWLDESAGASAETAGWLAGLLPGGFAGPLGDPDSRNGDARPVSAPAPVRRIGVAGLGFREIPGKQDFYVCETGASAASWNAFLQDEPSWQRENLAELVEQGLASADYLEGAEYFPGEPDPQTTVSWHAALAYCRWLSRQLPPGFEGFQARLPTEAEWAAYISDESPGTTRRNAQGAAREGLWEWCADPYTPLNFLPASPQAITAVSSPERVLQGGSGIRGVRQGETRASLPPEFCSPFVTFRPVIARTASGEAEQ